MFISLTMRFENCFHKKEWQEDSESKRRSKYSGLFVWDYLKLWAKSLDQWSG